MEIKGLYLKNRLQWFSQLWPSVLPVCHWLPPFTFSNNVFLGRLPFPHWMDSSLLEHWINKKRSLSGRLLPFLPNRWPCHLAPLYETLFTDCLLSPVAMSTLSAHSAATFVSRPSPSRSRSLNAQGATQFLAEHLRYRYPFSFQKSLARPQSIWARVSVLHISPASGSLIMRLSIQPDSLSWVTAWRFVLPSLKLSLQTWGRILLLKRNEFRLVNS